MLTITVGVGTTVRRVLMQLIVFSSLSLTVSVNRRTAVGVLVNMGCVAIVCRKRGGDPEYTRKTGHASESTARGCIAKDGAEDNVEILCSPRAFW